MRLFTFSEFFHTERSHVRNLKVLDRLFYRPLIESSAMSTDLAERLFPNLDEVLSLHNQYNQKMKERAKAGFPVGNIGDILTEMVSAAVAPGDDQNKQLTFVLFSVWRDPGWYPDSGVRRVHQEPENGHRGAQGATAERQ